MKNPYSIGKSVYLRAPCLEDIDGNWYQWFSDPEVTQYLVDRFWPNTKELQEDFYESIKSSRERLVLSICLSETDEHIGVCNLSAINWVHRYADIALVIGEKKYRNGVIAVETMSLLLNIAFNRLNLQNIKASHIVTNPSTPVLLKIFGFREAGRFSKVFYFHGDYVDFVVSQLSRVDWASRNER
jgi:ribosomal-protein-alanine N-acetyltransferase